MDLALSNLQRLICHKTLPTKQIRLKYGGFREGEARARAETRTLLDYYGYKFDGCNVSQMTLLGLGLTECNVSP